MANASTVPTSRRGYLSQAELEQYANITITDTTEADDQISIAEELIDTYVGFQQKFFIGELAGKAISGSTNTLELETLHKNAIGNDFYKWCYIEILGGTGAGQRRKIASSTKAGIITVEDNWSTAPDSTSFYKIFQLGKFPRYQDVTYYNEDSSETYYKQIPENIKRAVSAQIEFMIEMGTKFFSSDQTEKQSETLGDYSYTNMQGTGSIARLIAPKAKMYLRGIRNITGRIVI